MVHLTGNVADEHEVFHLMGLDRTRKAARPLVATRASPTIRRLVVRALPDHGDTSSPLEYGYSDPRSSPKAECRKDLLTSDDRFGAQAFDRP